MTTGPAGATGVPEFRDLPGWELVSAGLDDLAAGRETVAGELLKVASLQLAELGIRVPEGRSSRLYELVVDDVGLLAAHARYNALRRRLVSFLRTARDARAR